MRQWVKEALAKCDEEVAAARERSILCDRAENAAHELAQHAQQQWQELTEARKALLAIIDDDDQAGGIK
jgi:hypothetical protein